MSLHVPAPVRRVGPTATVVRDTATKAGPIGPGAGVLMTEWLMPNIMGNEPQVRMQKALKLGNEVDWVRAAERIIAGKVSSCEWHLEDPEGDTIDEEYKGDPLAKDAFTLLTYPQGQLELSGPGGIGKRQSRRQQLVLTSRHMGLAGSAAWYLDMIDGNGIPHAICYIRPDRLDPACTKAGVLTGWALDKSPGNPGTPIPVDQLLLFQLSPPDMGVFGMGLVESSMAKAINNGLIDRHYSALLSSGGRISGILSPKEGAINDDGVYNQLVRDWRNVTEQPEAARRLQIVRAPVEFTSTVQSVGEMQVIDLMYHNRDALLALWGVPLSMLGGAVSSGGLNSGDSRKYDEAALWQGPVHDRDTEIVETVQSGILDKFEAVLGGWAPKLVFDEPEFDDDLPNYEKVRNSSGLAMRNQERRALVGLEPFGHPELDNAIWMPVQVVAMAMGTDPDTGKVPEVTELAGFRMVDNPLPVAEEAGKLATSTPAVAPKPAAGAAPGQGASSRQASATKASAVAPTPWRRLDVQTVRLREVMQERITPRFQDALEQTFEQQKRAVINRILRNYDAIVRHGGRDESMWWSDREELLLQATIKPVLTGVVQAVEAHVDSAFSDPS